MADKSRWSFKFSFKRRMNLSFILLAGLLLTSVITTFAVKVIRDRRDQVLADSLRPIPNVEKWRKDLLLFHDKTGKYPRDFRELEKVIWFNGDDKKTSQLTNGENIFILENYLYLYYGDSVQDGQACSLWAIPIGAKKEDGSTYYVLLTANNYQLWKGLSLIQSDVERIPKKAIPLDSELARLGMSKQISEEKAKSTKSILTPFGFK